MIKKKTKQEMLLEAGLDVFAEKGFEKTTIDDIVAKAGCGKGTFYRYFKNKESLFEKLDEDFLEELEKAFKENCRVSMMPRDYLLAALNTTLQVFSLNRRIGLIRFERDFRMTSEQRFESSRKIINKLFIISNDLEKFRKEGKIKNFNSETITLTLIGAAHFFMFREFKLNIPHTQKEIEETIDILFYGVKPE